MNQRHGHFVCIVILLVFFVYGLENAHHASITVDEGLHIASGYSILTTGDYRLVEEHPPLVKIWLALPLLPLTGLPDPASLPAWETSKYAQTESVPLLKMAQQLLYPYQPVEAWLFPARVMSMFLGVFTISLLYRWANELWGIKGAVLVTALTAFDPNVIAHSAIAGTDMGAAFFILLALWAGYRFLKHPSFKLALVTGIVIGGALGTKLTAMMVIIPLSVVGMVKLRHARGYHRRILLQMAILTCFLSFLTLWGIYLFQIGEIPGTAFRGPMPAHAIPFLRLLQHAQEGHQAYLFGENSLHGWWSYFPAAFLVKTALSLLLLLPFTLVAMLKQHSWKGLSIKMTGLFLTVYGVTSISSSLNIGYRHILPLLFILYLWVGVLGRLKKKWMTWVTSGLLLYQMLNTGYHSPYLLGWFNRMSGGPENGWRYLADSNTDWGQGYQQLADFQKTKELPQLNLAGFIFYDPAIYGLNYTPLTPMRGDTPAVFPSRFAPTSGYYAISLTSLDGIPLADPEMYDWFRWRSPTERIANAIHYYEVQPTDTVNNWVAQCTTPLPPLSDAVIYEGFGSNLSQRYIPFDCTQSWVFPDQTAGSGAYILHGQLITNNFLTKLHYREPQAADPFMQKFLALTTINYQQRLYRETPAFAIYRMDKPPDHTTFTTMKVWAAPAESPPLQPSPGIELSTPVNLEGPIDFLLLNVARTQKYLEIETWWRVKSTSTLIQPISVMAHLLAENGEVIGVADGLGVTPDVWLPGDVIVQRHQFDLVNLDTKEPFCFRTGVYRLDNGQRMPLLYVDNADAIYVFMTD